MMNIEDLLNISVVTLLINKADNTPVRIHLITRIRRSLHHLFHIFFAGGILLHSLKTVSPIISQAGRAAAHVELVVAFLIMQDICPFDDHGMLQCRSDKGFRIAMFTISDTYEIAALPAHDSLPCNQCMSWQLRILICLFPVPIQSLTDIDELGIISAVLSVHHFIAVCHRAVSFDVTRLIIKREVQIKFLA